MSGFISKALIAEGGLSRNLIQPVINFGARFYLAYVFFSFGLEKVDDNLAVNQDTLNAFKDGFKIPYLSPELAANLATYTELMIPLFLIMGFLTRPAAIVLLILNIVALYGLHLAGWTNSVSNWQHILWGVLLLGIFAYGPSKLSIDHYLSKKMQGESTSLILTFVGIILLSAIGYYLLNNYY